MPTVVLNGAFVGLVYGLLAVGLVVTYRTSRIINFAYGETGMLAAFFYFDMRLGRSTSTIQHDHGIGLALPAALLIGALIGLAMEWTIARPLRSNPTLNGMVATIGASLLFLTVATQSHVLSRPNQNGWYQQGLIWASSLLQASFQS